MKREEYAEKQMEQFSLIRRLLQKFADSTQE